MTFESFCDGFKANESFWANFINHKTEDDNGTSYLNVAGVPGTWDKREKFIYPLDEILIKTKGKITNKVVDEAIKLFKNIDSNKKFMTDIKRDPEDFWLKEYWEKYSERYGYSPSKAYRTNYVEETYNYPGAFWLVRWLYLNVGQTLKKNDYREGYFSY